MEIYLKRSDTKLRELFYKLQSREDVADILEIDLKTLNYIIYRINDSQKYREFTIQKRDGTPRIIKAPIRSLKILQSKLNKIMQLIYQEKGKNSAHGFINGRSIVTNANPHVGKKQVLNLDLKDFFPSINFGRVRGMFNKTFNIGIEAATTLAQISCHGNELPQGSPCSPIISNLICRRLDTKLFYLSLEYGYKYTRYADDITFSSNKIEISKEIFFKDNEGVLHAGSILKRIIKENGFEINQEKVSFANRFEHQEVTGLVVNEKVNVRYSYVKNLRSMLFKVLSQGIFDTAIQYIEKYAAKVPDLVLGAKNDRKSEIVEKWFLEVIKGKLLYLKMIRGNEDLIFLKYAAVFNKIVGQDIFEVERYLDEKSWMNKRTVIIQDMVTHNGNGTGFYLKGYGLITCHHVIEVGDIYKIINPYTEDEYVLMKDKITSDRDLDVAIHDCINMNYCFEIEENPDYSIGQTIKLAGYPQYIEGSSLDIRIYKIASLRNYLGQKIVIVDGNIYKGASGGPVLNAQNKVIGIIRAGIEIFDEEDENDNMIRGFIPITVIDKLKKQDGDANVAV